VYDVSGTILAVNCDSDETRVVTGAAFLDAGTIYLTAVDSGRAHGYVFIGTR
jgi:hypothetical protein